MSKAERLQAMSRASLDAYAQEELIAAKLKEYYALTVQGKDGAAYIVRSEAELALREAFSFLDERAEILKEAATRGR